MSLKNEWLCQITIAGSLLAMAILAGMSYSMERGYLEPDPIIIECPQMEVIIS